MMRQIWLAALAATSTPVAAQSGSPTPAPATICAFGTDAESYRREAYCAAQVALRSTIARSFALLSARMATSDGALGAAIRRLQDADARVDLLTRQERQARSGDAAGATLPGLRRKLDEATAERVAASGALETSYPKWFALTRPRPISEAETAALLKPGEAMVFWLVGDKDTYAFAINRRGATWERIAIGRAALEQSVLELRQSLGVSGPTRGVIVRQNLERDRAALAARGLALHAQLFPGRIGIVARRAQSLLLVPSGPLSGLPFAALPTKSGRDPGWLGLAKPLALLPSPGDLRTLRGRPARAVARTAFAGYGAPLLSGSGANFGVSSRGGEAMRSAIAELPALPEAAEELRVLAAALGAPTTAVRTGADATERAVKSADLSGARIIAFATHGLVAGEVDGIGEGALVFTPPAKPDEIDDGVLTASEAAQLKLDADWILLSACSTAAGDRVGGEALSGLAAAFAYAGARALLVSHWQVRDDAARSLTTLAVTRRALGRGEALRQAMLAVAKDRNHPEWHDPAVWGVMTLIGDPAG